VTEESPPLKGGRLRLYGFLAAGAAAAVLLAGIASSAAEPSEHVITMSNMRYGRVPANVKVGDTILWVNNDTVMHSATARDRSFDVRIQPRQRVRMTVKSPGKFAIYCIIHPMMRGTLTVSQ
jgi:plastocyanin